LIRAQVKSVRERSYIRRTRALGASPPRTIGRHGGRQIGDPNLTSWGLLIENAFSRDAISVGAWWAIVPPGVAVAVVIVACTMVGTALEDALNPRLRVSHLSVRRYRLRPLVGRDRDAL